MGDVSVEGWRLVLIIVGIMLVMGVFGGFVNFLLGAKDDPDKSRVKSISAGIAASFLIPLFLRTIGSNLLSSKMAASDLLVLGGFCLIAGISSRAFMKSLAERLIQEAREVNKEVKQQAERVEELVSEPEEPTVKAVMEAGQGAAKSESPGLEPKAIAVLRALVDSRFVMRTISGIAMDTRLSAAEVSALLAELEKGGRAQVLQRPKGLRAVITAQGRDALMKTP